MSLTQPDILFIVLDTLRRDRLSSYGYRIETSPELDRFSQDATLFERAVAPAQWTIPAHGSLFTGLYPSTHQLIEADGRLSGSYPALAEILRLDGYHTVGFCNNPLVGVLDNGLQRGFNEFYNYAGAAPNRPQDLARSGLRRRAMQRFHRAARQISNRFAHNDHLFRLSLHPLLTPIWTRLINYKGHTANSTADVSRYWKKHHAGGREKPLFAFLNLMGAHLPYRPPQDALARMAPELKNDRRAYGFMARFNADAAGWASPAENPLTDDETRTLDAFYAAEVFHQDLHLGRMLHELEQSGALDHTMVIIAADHGEGHGDHDFFGHAFVVYQELVHVPLIIRCPDQFPAGKRVTQNVSTRRIFHTVLDAAGITPPMDESDPNANIHGLSLVAAVNGRVDTEGGVAFAEAFPPRSFLNVLEHRSPQSIVNRQLTQVRRGIYTGVHKLTTVGAQVEGLFNIVDDPAEISSLAAQQPETAAQMRSQLDALVADAESRRAEHTLEGEISSEVADNLRALGYID